MACRRERCGELEDADGRGIRTGDCGDTIEMFIAVEADRLRRVTFRIDGCCNTMAAANTVSWLIEGHSLADAWELTPDDVANWLETLPPDHYHCAELAVGAFYNALTDYTRRQQEKSLQVHHSSGGDTQ